jgi:hypothetical protein
MIESNPPPSLEQKRDAKLIEKAAGPVYPYTDIPMLPKIKKVFF